MNEHEWKKKKNKSTGEKFWRCKVCDAKWTDIDYVRGYSYDGAIPPIEGCYGKPLTKDLRTKNWKNYYLFYQSGYTANSIHERLSGYGRLCYPQKECHPDMHQKKKMIRDVFEEQYGEFQGAIFYMNGEVALYTKSFIMLVSHNTYGGSHGDRMHKIRRNPKFLKK